MALKSQRRDPIRLPPDTPIADNMRVGICDDPHCGSVHFVLMHNDKPLAMGAVRVEHLPNMMRDINECIVMVNSRKGMR